MKTNILISSIIGTLSIICATATFASDVPGQSDWQSPGSVAPQSQTQLGQSDLITTEESPTYQGQIQSNSVLPQTTSGNYSQPSITGSGTANTQTVQPPVQQSTPRHHMNIGAIANALSAAASVPLASAMSSKMAGPYGGYYSGYVVPAYPTYPAYSAYPTYPTYPAYQSYPAYYPAYSTYPTYYGYSNTAASGMANYMMGRAINQAFSH